MRFIDKRAVVASRTGLVLAALFAPAGAQALEADGSIAVRLPNGVQLRNVGLAATVAVGSPREWTSSIDRDTATSLRPGRPAMTQSRASCGVM